MSLFSAISDAISNRCGKRESCFPCAYFCDDPARTEAELPGLATFSSAHASVRAQDGLCLVQDRVINGRRRCAAFKALERKPAG
jgi:hypothetical protein